MPVELQVPNWTWWIVLYFFAGGIAGGAYFTATIIELVGGPEDRPIARVGYFIAFPLSLLCALLLTIDLGQPLAFWHMLVYSRTYARRRVVALDRSLAVRRTAMRAGRR